MFSEQDNKTPVKADAPNDLEYQNVSTTVSSEFCNQNSFKAAGWDGPASWATPA